MKVLPNSWAPEDESHEAFKDMIVKAFKDESRRKLEHICHDLAYQSIQWFGTPGGTTYTVIMMIIKQKDYSFSDRLTRVWGTYCEY